MKTISTFNVKLGILLKLDDYPFVFKKLNTDVIALQEVPLSDHERIGKMAQENNYPYWAYSPTDQTLKHGIQGNMLISRYPITDKEDLDISFGNYQKRIVQKCIVEVKQKLLYVLNIHFGLRPLEKRFQTKRLLEIALQYQNVPCIALGDFNDWDKQSFFNFRKAGFKYQKRIYTFPTRFPFMALDKIYLNKKVHGHGIHLLKGKFRYLSDHFPLVCSFDFI